MFAPNRELRTLDREWSIELTFGKTDTWLFETVSLSVGNKVLKEIILS